MTGSQPVREKLPVSGLMIKAGTGDKHVWDALVERNAPLDE